MQLIIELQEDKIKKKNYERHLIENKAISNGLMIPDQH